MKNNASKISLSVQYATDEKVTPTRAQFRRWATAALCQEASVTLRIVDEKEGHRLNKAYRGKDYATNVLTFVYDESVPLSGDIVLCAPVVKREAHQQHKELMMHYAHLTLHAMLHLQGYDHESEADAAVMEALETKLMVKLRYSDPYQEA